MEAEEWKRTIEGLQSWPERPSTAARRSSIGGAKNLLLGAIICFAVSICCATGSILGISVLMQHPEFGVHLRIFKTKSDTLSLQRFIGRCLSLQFWSYAIGIIILGLALLMDAFQLP